MGYTFILVYAPHAHVHDLVGSLTQHEGSERSQVYGSPAEALPGFPLLPAWLAPADTDRMSGSPLLRGVNAVLWPSSLLLALLHTGPAAALQ